MVGKLHVTRDGIYELLQSGINRIIRSITSVVVLLTGNNSVANNHMLHHVQIAGFIYRCWYRTHIVVAVAFLCVFVLLFKIYFLDEVLDV